MSETIAIEGECCKSTDETARDMQMAHQMHEVLRAEYMAEIRRAAAAIDARMMAMADAATEGNQ